MSSSKNLEFAKTAFLSKSNSAFIEQMYVKFVNNDPNLPDSWKKYFNEIGDEIDVMVIGVDNMGKIDLSRRAILNEESLDVVKERRNSGRKNDRNNRGGRGGRGGRDNYDRNSRGGGRNRRSVGGYDGDSRPSPPSRY